MPTGTWLAREPARHCGEFFLKKISSQVLRLVRRFLLKFYDYLEDFFLSLMTTSKTISS